MSTFLELAQTLQMTLKALQMYTSVHPRSQAALKTLENTMGEWLKERPQIQMAASAGKVFLDGIPVEGNSLHLTALVRQLTERQIAGFIIQRGAPTEELLAMLEILILKPAKLEEMGGVAKVLATRNLRYISLSQTQYREVREGEGGHEDHGGASSSKEVGPTGGASRTASPEPLAIDIAEALDQWRQHLSSALQGLSIPTDTGSLGSLPAANLGNLGRMAEEAGWGAGFPTAVQMEPLRQALKNLPGEGQFAILKGLGTLPVSPAGFHMGFQALAPELITQAAVGMLAKGSSWPDLREALYGILSLSPQKQAMLAGLEAAVESQGIQAGQFEDLLRQLEWDNQSTDEQIRRSTEVQRLWNLSLEQRIGFLRELLKQGRTEPFLRILEQVLEVLTREEPHPRQLAAQTLAAISHWVGEPEFPLEAEGPLLDGLKGHFGWEPILHIHRATEEGLEALLLGFLARDEITHVQALLQELQGLLSFMEDKQDWRGQSLERLLDTLSAPPACSKAIEGLQRAAADTVLQVYVPYFEFLGEPGARELLRVLGQEPDRKRRGRLLDVIRALGPLALPALHESLTSPTWYLVRNTLNLMADMGDAGMLADVARCLQHADGRVKRAAVRALWKLGGPASAPYLVPLFSQVDVETQVEILFGLGQIQSGMAVFPLADFARQAGTDERLRIKTIETLGQIGNPSAIQPLAELIRRKGRIFTTVELTEVRMAAARALMTIGTAQAVEALKKLMEEEPRSKDRDALQQILTSRPQGKP